MPATTIRYMGSKRSLAPAIASLIHESYPQATIVDVFAGTCAIGTAMAPRHRVIANDVHEYAAIVARALLVTPGPVPTLAMALRDIRVPYEQNLNRLREVLRERLDQECQAIFAVSRPGSWNVFQQFVQHDLHASYPIQIPGLDSPEIYHQHPRTFPYALFSMYFGNGYFGLLQAAEIDSLRFAIDQAPPDRRDFYLLALIHALSHCTASPGHFAQFLVPRDATNSKYIARIRKRCVFKRFFEELCSLNLPVCLSRAENEAHCSEALTFVESQLQNRIDQFVIYADPPYSRAQYSRYYHVLETLIRYDYPTATGKGRYRDDRLSTGFSRAAMVGATFESFIAGCRATGAPLFLSYPQNGLYYRGNESLLELLRTYYANADVAYSIPLAHSTMGGAPGTASIQVNEEVFRAH